MVYNALDIAKYVIEESKKDDSSITNLKLQKLLYYIQGYSLKETSEPAFDDDIVNWAYGPVVQDVYFEFCSYVSNPINENYEDDEVVKSLKKSLRYRDVLRIIRKIIKKTRDIDAYALVRKTHKEDPWEETVRNDVISQEKILKYFSENDPLCLED